MSQENQTMNAASVENLPVKRKRGRPRKNENLIHGDRTSATPRSDAVKRRNRRRRGEPKAGTDGPMVGQVVSGVLDGSFDAGYLLTVRVGNSNRVLRGIVFEPRLSVPVSGANDVAPQVQMLKRIEIPLKKPAPVHCSNSQGEQKCKSPVKLLPTNGVSVATKVSSPVKHAPQVATQELPSQMQTALPLASKEASNNVNNVPQSVPQALQKVEIRIENQVVESQATGTQIKKKEVIVLPDDETHLFLGTAKSQAVTTQTKSLPEIPRTCLNERPSKVTRTTEKDTESGCKTKQPVPILEIDGSASEQSVLPKAASVPPMSNLSALSKIVDLVPGEGVSPLQFQNYLFSNTGSIG